ncbi:MAG TPA: WD40 repeat domain-containing protein, partial [Pilimelia sp.]|nr:WD40 repeat domain-containing protein [Pilimelia sp.]
VARHAGALMPGSAGVVDVIAATAIDTRPVAVTGSPDGVVRVWDLASGQPAYAPLTGHKARITAVAVDNGNPPIAVSACAEGVVRVWDLTTEDIPDVGATHTTDVSAMTADESRVVVATSDGGVHVMDIAAGKPFGPAIPVHPYGVTAVTTADVHGFHVLLTGAADGRVRRWDPVTGELIGRPLVGNGRPVRALAAVSFADRTIALAADGDGHVEMWDLETGELLPSLPAHHSGETTAVAAAALDRGLAVVTGYADGTITVNPATGSQRAAVIAGRGAPVTALATASVGSHLLVLSGDTDRKARIWDVDPHDGSRRFGRRFRSIEETSLDCVPSCAALRLARTGMPIAAFSAGEDVRLWRARTAVDGLGLQAPVTALTFGDDNVLLIGTERGLICLAVTGLVPARAVATTPGAAGDTVASRYVLERPLPGLPRSLGLV